MNFEKLTEYLDSLPGRGIPSVDCIITKGYERVYRHMAGTTDKDYSVPVNGNELYLMFSMIISRSKNVKFPNLAFFREPNTSEVSVSSCYLSFFPTISFENC